MMDRFFLIWNDVKFVLLKNLLFDELISLLIGNFFFKYEIIILCVWLLKVIIMETFDILIFIKFDNIWTQCFKQFIKW